MLTHSPPDTPQPMRPNGYVRHPCIWGQIPILTLCSCCWPTPAHQLSRPSAARGDGRISQAHPLRMADYLQHILEAIGNIQDYTADMDLAAFFGRPQDLRRCDSQPGSDWRGLQQRGQKPPRLCAETCPCAMGLCL